MTQAHLLGERQNDSMLALCDQAAECIRGVNHLTYPGACELAIAYPAYAYRAIDALHLLVHRLPQAIGQIQRAVQRMIDAHLVVFDRGTPYAGDPDRAGQDLRTSIAAASATLHAVGGALDRAAQILANAALDEPVGS
jgi:hypothetical protein